MQLVIIYVIVSLRHYIFGNMFIVVEFSPHMKFTIEMLPHVVAHFVAKLKIELTLLTQGKYFGSKTKSSDCDR